MMYTATKINSIKNQQKSRKEFPSPFYDIKNFFFFNRQLRSSNLVNLYHLKENELFFISLAYCRYVECGVLEVFPREKKFSHLQNLNKTDLKTLSVLEREYQ